MDYTAKECRERAKLKIRMAVLDPQNAKTHVEASDAWLLLARRIDELDGIAVENI